MSRIPELTEEMKMQLRDRISDVRLFDNEFHIDRKFVVFGVKRAVDALAIISYRVYKRKRKEYSNLRVSLRRYRWSRKQLQWKRSQNLNVNSLKQARLIVQALRMFFPVGDV